MPALVVPAASTVRKCSHTFDFTCSQNLQVRCNSYWPTTPQGCCWDWLKSIVTMIVPCYWLSEESWTLFKNGETLLVALSLSLSLSMFSLFWCPAALSFDRQVWECERTAPERDRHWPQTVSLQARSTGACSGSSHPQTAARVAPCQPSSALFEGLLSP